MDHSGKEGTIFRHKMASWIPEAVREQARGSPRNLAGPVTNDGGSDNTRELEAFVRGMVKGIERDPHEPSSHDHREGT